MHACPNLAPTNRERVRPVIDCPHASRAIVLVALLVACLLGLCTAPALSYADGYDMPRVDIHATVQENGDLTVTEERTFSFDDDVNGVYWTVPAAKNQQGQVSTIAIDGVSVAAVDEDDAARFGDEITFSQVDSAENGQSGVYTVEQTGEGTRLKVFTPQEDGASARIRVTYTLAGAVMAWADTAELYWQFVGEDWEEPSENVSLAVTFAGAANGPKATTGSSSANFRAWGHGPLDGSVALDAGEGASANPTVTFAAPRVRSGQFAEARVLFPTAWVPGLAASADSRVNTVLAEEEAWANEANEQRERARTIATAGTAALTGAPLALLAATLFLRLTKYKNPRPVFDETYFRDLPSDDHPAVLSAFLAHGTVRDCAFVATLMRLTDERVITLRHETFTESKLFGEREVEDYVITLVNRDAATDAIDQAALDLYFGRGAQNGNELRFDDMKRRAKHDDHMHNRYEDFTHEIKAELERRGLTDRAPMAFKAGAGALAVALVLAGILFIVFTDAVNLLWVLAGIVVSTAAAIVAATTQLYSQEAVELRNRCEALKRWLEDFTRLNEAVPDDLILWDKLLVMAVAFDVSDEVVRQLADAVPADRRQDAYGNYYYPSYWWYYSYGRMDSPMREMSSAYAATVSELVGSSDSSGGGFGGGFSGGGGGGVGGGGGGTF